MATSYASVKLSSALVGEARREAETLQRSVGAQVEYWARLGRAVENTPGFDLELIRTTLEGKLRLDALSASEQPVALRAMGAAFDAPDSTATAYYAEMGDVAGAVGSDGRGGLVRRQAVGRSKPTR